MPAPYRAGTFILLQRRVFLGTPMPSGFVGSNILIEVETGDAREPDFSRLTGTVREVIDFGAGPAALIVDLRKQVALSGGAVNEMLLLGEVAHFGDKLLESVRSQLTLSVPVLLYRASDPSMLAKFRQSKRVPPSTAYLGRAAVLLQP